MFKIDFDNLIIRQDMEQIDSCLSKEKLCLYNKSIFVSGASGMIASYLMAYLIWLNETQGASIHIYAGIRNKEKAYLRFGNYAEKPYFSIIAQDINEPIIANQKFDYIIHAASLASPQYYGCMPVETMLPNIIGTNNLLKKAMIDHSTSFLFFSSGSVYGSIEGHDVIEEGAIGTFDFQAKGNVYGESKRCGEALCRSYFNEFGIPIKIARIHHTYGATADIEQDTRVFSEFAADIINCRDIVLKSSGEARRSFCYITDTISGLLKILLFGENGEAYNIGNPNEYISIAELANTLVELFPEKRLHVVSGHREEKGYNASTEKRIIPVSVEKIENLEWKPVVSIQEGFTRMIHAIEYSLLSAKGEE